MQEKVLAVQSRTLKKKNSCNRLRNEGFIPGIIYSHGKSESIQVPRQEFSLIFKGHISESVLFSVHVDGKSDDQLAFVKDYQRNPSTGELLHVDFFKVTKGEKIHTTVPIKIIGTAKGTKVGGLTDVSKHELEVECLPKDLPEEIVIDITDVDINEYIHARDIKVSDSVKIKTNPETVIVSVHPARTVAVEGEVEAVEVPEGEAAPEAEGD